MTLGQARKIGLVALCLSGFIMSSCNRLSEADRQRLFMATLGADPIDSDPALVIPPSKLLPAEADKGAKGFCGDGIINGDEYCDGTTLTDHTCDAFNGISGDVRCRQDCKLDIANCLTPAVDRQIGGRAETCKCNCSGNNCDGGCAVRGIAVGVSRCQFRCEQECVCNCGDLLQGHIDRCDFECDCQIDGGGNPQCICAQNQCDIIVTTKPNIGTIAAHKLRSSF
jgi:hypothetical protein